MVLLALCSLGLLAQAQDVPVKGSITEEGVSMTPLEVAAVCDPKSGELRVAFVPFKLNAKMIQSFKRDRLMLDVLSHPTPDPTKWATWCPYGEVTIKMDPANLGGGPKAIRSYTWVVYGMKQKNFTTNVQDTGEQAEKDLSTFSVKVDPTGAGVLQWAWKGTAELSQLSWNLTVKCPILPASTTK